MPFADFDSALGIPLRLDPPWWCLRFFQADRKVELCLVTVLGVKSIHLVLARRSKDAVVLTTPKWLLSDHSLI